jgi:predicted HicB family RNase H-like nuclease
MTTNTKQVNFRVPENAYKTLSDMAARDGRSVSNLLQKILANALAKNGHKPK